MNHRRISLTLHTLPCLASASLLIFFFFSVDDYDNFKCHCKQSLWCSARDIYSIGFIMDLEERECVSERRYEWVSERASEWKEEKKKIFFPADVLLCLCVMCAFEREPFTNEHMCNAGTHFGYVWVLSKLLNQRNVNIQLRYLTLSLSLKSSRIFVCKYGYLYLYAAWYLFGGV